MIRYNPFLVKFSGSCTNQNFSIETQEDSENIANNDTVEPTAAAGISAFNYQFHIDRLKNRISKLNKLDENTEAEKK